MQDEIRNTDKNDFGLHDTFVQYKNNNELSNPDETAAQLVNILKNPEKFKDVVLDLRQT